MDGQKLLPMCVNPRPGSWSWAASLCNMEPPSGEYTFIFPALSSAGSPEFWHSPFDSSITGEPVFCFDLNSFYSRNL